MIHRPRRCGKSSRISCVHDGDEDDTDDDAYAAANANADDNGGDDDDDDGCDDEDKDDVLLMCESFTAPMTLQMEAYALFRRHMIGSELNLSSSWQVHALNRPVASARPRAPDHHQAQAEEREIQRR
eukprot:911106-Rhodomonas_salina.1